MIDETLSKDDVQRGDTIVFYAPLKHEFARTCPYCDNDTDDVVLIPTRRDFKVRNVFHRGRPRIEIFHQDENCELVIDNLDFGIHYRVINDPRRYEKPLFEI